MLSALAHGQHGGGYVGQTGPDADEGAAACRRPTAGPAATSPAAAATACGTRTASARPIPGVVAGHSTASPPPAAARAGSAPSGVGCDYQVNSSIVIGAFGDWDFGEHQGPICSSFLRTSSGTESEQVGMGRAGGRIGWLVTPTVLTYFTAGYTQAHFDAGELVHVQRSARSAFGPVSLPTNTYHGWFLGSGFEYASLVPAHRLLPEDRIPLLDLSRLVDLSEVVDAIGVLDR